VIKLGTIR